MIVAKADLLYYAHEYSQAHALTKQVLDKDPYHKVRSRSPAPCRAAASECCTVPEGTRHWRPRGVRWAS